MLNHLDEETLILLYYNEPEVSAAQRAHLAECTQCRLEMEQLQGALRMADQFHVPEPSPQFEQRLWARLSASLEPQTPKRRSSWFRFPRLWMPGLAVAGLLIGAFYLGRATLPKAEAPIAGLSAKARERILVISLADHLERAGMLLTEVENDGNFDRERAKDLVSEGRVMQQALERVGLRTSEPLLDDVENVLLEVANAPSHLNPAVLAEVRRRIGSESLLFKVRVVETNLRAKGQKL